MTEPLPTQRRQRFATAYAAHGNAARAATDAGYSARTAKQAAWRLLREPRVQDLIAQARHTQERAIEEQTVFTLQRWVREVVGLYEEARASNNLTAANRALHLLGQHLGALEPQPAPDPGVARMFDMLGQLIEKRNARDQRATIEGTSRPVDPVNGK